MTKNTKAGPDFFSGPLTGVEHDTWRECFAAAIAGTLSAHRASPNPDLIVRLAAAVADRALLECRKRRRAA